MSTIRVQIREHREGGPLLRVSAMTHIPREGDRLVLTHDTYGDEMFVVRNITWDMRQVEPWVTLIVISAAKRAIDAAERAINEATVGGLNPSRA